MVRSTYFMPKPMRAALKAEADRRDINESDLVREMIWAKLDELNQPKQTGVQN